MYDKDYLVDMHDISDTRSMGDRLSGWQVMMYAAPARLVLDKQSEKTAYLVRQTIFIHVHEKQWHC